MAKKVLKAILIGVLAVGAASCAQSGPVASEPPASVVAPVQAAKAADPRMQQFWTQNRCSLDTDEGLRSAIEFLDMGKEAGLTHLVLGDASMSRWDVVNDAYIARIAAYRQAAKERGIEIVPSLFPIGYGGRYTTHDPNLAAGLPVKDAPFIAHNGVALPDMSAAPQPANAGFEESGETGLPGWTTSAQGTNVALDTEEKHSGASSLRITAEATTTEEPAEGRRRRRRGGCTLTQTFAVEPFKYYRVSVWVKTDNAGNQGEGFINVTSKEGKRRNTYYNVQVEATQDWTRVSSVFNTLDAESVEFSISPRAGDGTIWIDDVVIEPAGILNVVRRDLVPLSVKSADGSITYEEGRDFEPVTDPAFMKQPDADVEHEAAPIRLTAASRIAEGERLLVSYYYTPRIYTDQVVLTLSDPALYALMDKHMEHISKTWPAAMYFSTADEIRVAGWEMQPDGENLTIAQLLARYMERSIAIMKKYMPDARMAVWSDMFTPFHNARPFEDRGYYYLTTGTFYGSWSGLPREVLIANWYSPNKLNPVWFEVRGHEQIMCGYYDTNDLKGNINNWMKVTNGVDGVVGLMYTQWSTGHERMKEFFDLARTYDEWAAEFEASRNDIGVRER